MLYILSLVSLSSYHIILFYVLSRSNSWYGGNFCPL